MLADNKPAADTRLEAPALGEPYLLTPGPLTTSYAVKRAMLRDWGSWDDDFRAMTADLRSRLLALIGGDAQSPGVETEGDMGVLSTLLGVIDPGDDAFAIVTP